MREITAQSELSIFISYFHKREEEVRWFESVCVNLCIYLSSCLTMSTAARMDEEKNHCRNLTNQDDL